MSFCRQVGREPICQRSPIQVTNLQQIILGPRCNTVADRNGKNYHKQFQKLTIFAPSNRNSLRTKQFKQKITYTNYQLELVFRLKRAFKTKCQNET